MLSFCFCCNSFCILLEGDIEVFNSVLELPYEQAGLLSICSSFSDFHNEHDLQ